MHTFSCVRLDAKKLTQLGIKPGPDYKRIKDGETLISPSGDEVQYSI